MLLLSLKLSTVGFRVYTLGELSPAAQMVHCASGAWVFGYLPTARP